MSATQTIHSLPRSTAPRSVGVRGRGRPAPVETLDETASLIGAPPIYGPPAVFLLGPWLLLVLLLIPPAAFLITLALVAVVAGGLLVALCALIASPYLLVRHVHARHSAHRRQSASVPRPVRAVRAAPAVSEVTGPRGWHPEKQPAGAHLVHLTAR
jgi:hypothetical protein